MTIAKEKQQMILDELIDGLSLGRIPWQMPCFAEMPQNLSGRKYSGINALYLMYIAKQKGYERNVWGTFNQIRSAGASVNAGAKSVPIVYWSILEKDVVNKQGKKDKQEIPILKYFNVFNIAGQTNLKLPEKQASNFNPVERAEEIIKNNNPSIVVSVDGNYYVKNTDTIHIQKPETFYDQNDYYSVFFHELGHWTGHESRLKRPLESLSKNKDSYGVEELIAEIASSFIMQELGLPINKINTQAYINGWSSFLKDQKQELIKASSKASKVVEYLLKNKPQEVLA